MSDSPLITKSKGFALAIIKLCNTVKKEHRESVLTNQLLRSGTSIGANIREVFLHIASLILLPNSKLRSKNVPKANIG